MRVAYLECFSGISGDMMLGALLDAGVSEELLQRSVAALKIGAELRISRVDRGGVSATKVDVLVNGKEADHVEHSHHDHEHAHDHRHSHSHAHGHDHEDAHTHSSNTAMSGAPESNGDHHGHSHAHSHQHGRSLFEIRNIIRAADLPDQARDTAILAFELLGEAEAGIHNVPVESIHFHEVGAVDAIADIVGASVGCYALGVDRFICSSLNVGGGTVKCAHGEFPVPAPGTLALLKGAPVYSSGINKELVTPTGAALVCALNCSFSAFPRMSVESIGYGAGSRDLDGSPNVLRISIGELVETQAASSRHDSHHEVTVLETTIDDLSPQVMGYVTERLLADGALDAFIVPAQMKKNRPGSLLTVLCDEKAASTLREIIFRETSTIGIRTRRERRDCLERAIISVSTQWGVVRVKESRLNGSITNFAPEYEDCRRIAEANAIPLKQVQQATINSYLSQQKSLSTSGDSAASLSTKSQVA